jgi:hypothetical protein
MILEDSIKIEASPEAAFQFFEEMGDHYLAWHPDHVLFRWEGGRGVKRGNTFYFEEYIAGKLLRKRCVFTRVVPGEHLEFAPTFWLMRFFLPRMVFRVVPEGDGCRLIAQIEVRMGPLGRWAHRKEFDAVREHMRVEGVNAKRMIEAQEQGLASSHSDAVGQS